jgi:hypothetical protein
MIPNKVKLEKTISMKKKEKKEKKGFFFIELNNHKKHQKLC